LSLVVVLRSLGEVVQHPEVWSNWQRHLAARGDSLHILLLAGLIFPKLALGLSGFETGVSVMPLIQGSGAAESGAPLGRIRATRRLLGAAAGVMSVMLLGSSFATTLLIPDQAFQPGGEANGRALAYLAHKYLGTAFGTFYDMVTIAILWLAGASAMAALLNLIPRYLPRFGMAPRWVAYPRPLVLVFFAVNLVITLIFKADVDAQAGAYATGVLVLILSAAIAVTLAQWRERPAAGLYFGCTALVFAFALGDNVLLRPDGVIIAGAFIFLTLSLSGLSRYRRATELRVEHMRLADAESEQLWPQLREQRINLVPIKHPSRADRWEKSREIQASYKVEGPVVFLHVELLDDRSEFAGHLEVRIRHVPDRGHYLMTVHGAVALANTIAYLSERLDPRAIFLGLTRRNPMGQAFKYLLWGEGETGLMVYQILLRHWESTVAEDVRPAIFLMSD
jgi:hypothetical protein